MSHGGDWSEWTAHIFKRIGHCNLLFGVVMSGWLQSKMKLKPDLLNYTVFEENEGYPLPLYMRHHT